MVDDKTFNGSYHFAGCTIFHSRHADQYEVHRTTAPKETIFYICKICECMFFLSKLFEAAFCREAWLVQP